MQEFITDNDSAFKSERLKMVKDQIEARDVNDKSVLKAMGRVPRHLFVPGELQRSSYADMPLSIGYGQTISQPYIVAIMTQLLNVTKDDVVLEIGTGSGYQTAVLAMIAKKIYTIEIVNELGVQVESRLKMLGYDNVEMLIGDGYNGWSEHAPYDGIIVTAAPEKIPSEIIKQLKNGGRIVIPTGRIEKGQVLQLISKDNTGQIKKEDIIYVRFVPLIRG